MHSRIRLDCHRHGRDGDQAAAECEFSQPALQLATKRIGPSIEDHRVIRVERNLERIWRQWSTDRGRCAIEQGTLKLTPNLRGLNLETKASREGSVHKSLKAALEIA